MHTHTHTQKYAEETNMLKDDITNLWVEFYGAFKNRLKGAKVRSVAVLSLKSALNSANSSSKKEKQSTMDDMARSEEKTRADSDPNSVVLQFNAAETLIMKLSRDVLAFPDGLSSAQLRTMFK